MSERSPAPPDPFFNLDGPTEWNAYVGRQGEEHYYVDGFLEAALTLAATIIREQLVGNRDTLVMPILFNARHGVELSLKHAVRVLSRLKLIRAPALDYHHLRPLYAALRQAPLGDEELTALVAQLEPFVLSLSAVDEDGQALRYPVRRGGEPSLQEYALANIAVILISLKALHECLERLKSRVLEIVDERASGTYTKALSRSDLFAITRLLPQRAQWTDPSFDEAKSAIRARFGLSGRQFSEALDLIQRHRQMGAKLGLEFSLAHLSDDHLYLVVDRWKVAHPERPREAAGVFDSRRIGIEEIIAQTTRDQTATDEIVAALSEDEIADLEAVYYLGRESGWPESYDDRLRMVKREHRAHGDLNSKVGHLVEKTNLPTALATGVAILGRPRTGEAVLQLLAS